MVCDQIAADTSLVTLDELEFLRETLGLDNIELLPDFEMVKRSSSLSDEAVKEFKAGLDGLIKKYKKVLE